MNVKKITKRKNSISQDMQIRERGITLIALIVTIIILLILAGITINVAIGDNGLFQHSREAVNKYKSAEANESAQLENLLTNWDNIIDGGTTSDKTIVGATASEVKSKITGSETNPTAIKIANKEIVIPAGLTIAEDSGETVDDGIVVVDKQGNEWVWIPCYVDENNKHGATIKFDRYDFAVSNFTKSQCIEDIDVDGSLPTTSQEYQSINKYGGYYIARYEAGDKETTALGKKRGDEGTNIDITNGDTNNTMVIKKNQATYNYVTYEQSKSLSEGLTSNYNGKAFTKICSSYGWDTALKFIENKNTNYPTDSTGGNYSESLKNTGDSTAFCNIYDLGGNVWERTSETNSGNHIFRGGGFKHSANDYPPCQRSIYNNDLDSNDDGGFRPMLFIK